MAAGPDEDPVADGNTETVGDVATSDGETPSATGESDPDEQGSEAADEVTDEVTDPADEGLLGLGGESGDREKSLLRRYGLRGAMGVLVIALLVASGFLGWKLWQQDQVIRAGQDAQQAAVRYAQILTSIDTSKVDENFNQVLEGATGEFKDMYSQSSMQLRQLLIDNKASAHGVVLDSAVQSATKDKVVVLLFVDQSVSNTNVPDPRIDRSRIKMTMEKVDDRWRASKVELP
jgi:Mce-associated membrane protein